MRGGFIHNEVLTASLLCLFEEEGWSCDTEIPVRMGEGLGFIDLVAEFDGYCIAVEVEMSAKRIDRDLQKAAAIHAAELWIVTPNARIAGAVRRAFHRMDVRVACDEDGFVNFSGRNGTATDTGGMAVFVLTQGAAAKRLRDSLRMFAGA
jgi:Holliday junction resolvase-like predicted endonuclease